MPDDIIRTLDGLDARWKNDVGNVEFDILMYQSFEDISSALRRAMAVVSGLREMDFRDIPLPEPEDDHEVKQLNRFMGINLANGKWRKERDRLLSENGFGKGRWTRKDGLTNE